MIAAANADDEAPPALLAALQRRRMVGRPRGDLLRLCWQNVDLKTGTMKTWDGRGELVTVRFDGAARKILVQLRAARSGEAVFAEPGAARAALVAAWDRLRERAGVTGMRLHDLRHSFASAGAASGESLVVIGSLLGHRTPMMTARYAHLSVDPRRAAADRIAGRIAVAMGDGPAAGALVKLGRRSRA